jgi:hypothetical protein
MAPSDQQILVTREITADGLTINRGFGRPPSDVGVHAKALIFEAPIPLLARQRETCADPRRESEMAKLDVP